MLCEHQTRTWLAFSHSPPQTPHMWLNAERVLSMRRRVLLMSGGSGVDRLAARPGLAVAASGDAEHSAVEPLWRRAVRHIYWPLAAVLAVQAAFSLSLVWSNSAYGDEAQHILD